MDLRFQELIVCPECLGHGEFGPEAFLCNSCDTSYPIIDGVLVFADDTTKHVDRRGVTQPTNPYPRRVVELLQSSPGLVILDFGAGHPRKEHQFGHVLRHDFAQYDNTHVVCTKASLPYRQDSFDMVISMSVFEHLSDPWRYASEIHRVTKPGGRVIIDVAFMQPLHGDPHHFYNMTERGLAHTFRMFREIETGVAPRYQSPGVAMNIITRRFLDLVQDETWGRFLSGRIGDVDFRLFDCDIADVRFAEMAAGVYLHAVK